jgi:hypothetical protein
MEETYHRRWLEAKLSFHHRAQRSVDRSTGRRQTQVDISTFGSKVEDTIVCAQAVINAVQKELCHQEQRERLGIPYSVGCATKEPNKI